MGARPETNFHQYISQLILPVLGISVPLKFYSFTFFVIFTKMAGFTFVSISILFFGIGIGVVQAWAECSNDTLTVGSNVF